MQNLLSLMRLYAEFGFVALGMAFCLITGGIDLSVGAIFALCNFAALFFLNVARTAGLAGASSARWRSAPRSAASTAC